MASSRSRLLSKEQQLPLSNQLTLSLLAFSSSAATGLVPMQLLRRRSCNQNLRLGMLT